MVRRARHRRCRVTGRVRPHRSLRQIRKAPASMECGVAWSLRGIVRPIHGPHPSALRAPGPAFGCPILFQTKLSLAEAGCRNEHRRSRWPEGRGTGGAESPGGVVLHLSPLPDTQSAGFDGVWSGMESARDCSAHPWASPFRAARSRASLRLSNFVPDKIVARGGRMPERTSAQPMARRARHGRCRVTERGRPPPLAVTRYAKRRLRWSVERHGVCEGLFGPSMGLTLPRCALQGQPSAVQIRSGRICRTREGSSTPLSPPDTQNAPEGRFAYLAEREGFEPSIRLLTRYSLSRGAPSATRASLRVVTALLRSRQGY